MKEKGKKLSFFGHVSLAEKHSLISVCRIGQPENVVLNDKIKLRFFEDTHQLENCYYEH